MKLLYLPACRYSAATLLMSTVVSWYFYQNVNLIVVYVLNGGHPTQLHGEKKIIIETREKCETIKRSPPSK